MIAWVAELADAPDLKSGAPQGAYGFDPRPGHLFRKSCRLARFHDCSDLEFFKHPLSQRSHVSLLFEAHNFTGCLSLPAQPTRSVRRTAASFKSASRTIDASRGPIWRP